MGLRMDQKMEYIVYDQIRNGDLYTGEFSDLDSAIRYAEREWSLMSDHDQGRRECYGVLRSANPDPDAVDHMDGELVWTP